MSRRLRQARHGAVAAVAAALLAVPSAPASGIGGSGSGDSGSGGNGIGVALLDGPASQAHNPRARLYIIDQVPAGTVLVRHVRVSNSTGTAQTVSLYPAAAAITDGTFQFGPGRTGNELTSWIRLRPDSLRLAANTAATVTATITVPDTAAASERYAVLWAQAVAAGAVREVNRVGIRVYLDISSTPGRTDFTIRSMRAGRDPDGHSTLTATVANTGSRALDLTGRLMLGHGPGGASAGPFQAGPSTIGPGQVAAVPIATGRDLAGRWRATLTLTSDTTTRTAAAEISFPSAGGTGPTVAVQSSGYRHWPPWWVWLLLAAVLADGARRLSRARQPKHRRPAPLKPRHGR